MSQSLIASYLMTLVPKMMYSTFTVKNLIHLSKSPHPVKTFLSTWRRRRSKMHLTLPKLYRCLARNLSRQRERPSRNHREGLVRILSTCPVTTMTATKDIRVVPSPSSGLVVDYIAFSLVSHLTTNCFSHFSFFLRFRCSFCSSSFSIAQNCKLSFYNNGFVVYE